ncbi:probable magnesium transporter NIPA2 isoform X2 [Oryza sativa Japonica Group]|nr:probable magnesium transporter NIPA2 isoform X2 [Oryza sativa Japonica Group]
MSPIRPKDRPGIGERWSGLGSGFRAAVAIPTVKSVPLPLPLSLPSAARCWPPPPPQVSLPFPSLPVPVFASPAPRSPRVPRLRLHARAEAADGVPHVRLADRPRALADRRGSGGFSYLYEPLWWLGMITMILGEVANFAAYAFAPAVLVTPLGALSIIFSAVLAHFVLKEKLHMFGVVGCILCVVGSVGIVLHAPKEREIDSIDEIWHLATEPGFIVYSCVAVVSVLFLIFWVAERSGHRKMLVYIAICSTMGSLTVISVKAVAIALKLSFGGSNQFIYIQTWFFIVVVIVCCLVQLNYLNKALDSFNTAVVSPVYYVMFTILTIFANMIMYKDSFSRNATQIATQLCGFVTIVAGTFLLHKTRDMGNEPPLPDDEICLDGGSVRPDRLSQSSS